MKGKIETMLKYNYLAAHVELSLCRSAPVSEHLVEASQIVFWLWRGIYI